MKILSKLNSLLEKKLSGLILYISFTISILFTFLFLNQPIIEEHAFRQTQTALTSLYLLKDGFQFDYRTPTLGYPWSIPFEFPIYQWIVAITYKYIFSFINFNLDMTGRLISYLFFLGCLFPYAGVIKLFNIPIIHIKFFISTIISSSFYLFWASTFLIESTVLFFSLSFLYFSLLIIFKKEESTLNYLLMSLFLVLALLQKITTSFPILLIVFLLRIFTLRSFYYERESFYKLFRFCSYLILPSLIFLYWTYYSENVRSLNFFGALINEATFDWNFGPIKLAFDPLNWLSLFFYRLENIPIYLLSLIYIPCFIFWDKFRNITIIFLFTALTLAPVLIFRNVHAIHNYYQFSSYFFLFTIPLLFIYFSNLNKYKYFLYLLLIIINLASFFTSDYFNKRIEAKTVENNSILNLANFIKNKSNNTDRFVLIGHDWSSAIPYYSERLGLVVPAWNKNYEIEAIKKPLKFLDKIPNYYILCFQSIDDLNVYKELLTLRNYQEINKGNECIIFTKK